MARGANFQRLVVGAFYADGFKPRLERARSVGRQVATGAVELLEIKILHVGPGVGEAPRNARIAADEDAGKARKGGADHVEPRRAQLGEVPNRRRGQTEMRIVREERLAARRVRARNRPAVRSQREIGVGAGRGACDARRLALEAAVELAQVANRRRRVARVGRQKLVDPLDAQRARKPHAQQLVSPVAAEVPRHHLQPRQRIDRAPGLGPYAQQQEFGRQHRVGGEECIHACGIGVERGARLGVEALEIRLRRAAHAERAQEAIGLQRRGPEHFGQPPGRDPAVHLELPEAILRMHESRARTARRARTAQRHAERRRGRAGFLPAP